MTCVYSLMPWVYIREVGFFLSYFFSGDAATPCTILLHLTAPLVSVLHAIVPNVL